MEVSVIFLSFRKHLNGSGAFVFLIWYFTREKNEEQHRGKVGFQSFPLRLWGAWTSVADPFFLLQDNNIMRGICDFGYLVNDCRCGLEGFYNPRTRRVLKGTLSDTGSHHGP